MIIGEIQHNRKVLRLYHWKGW